MTVPDLADIRCSGPNSVCDACSNGAHSACCNTPDRAAAYYAAVAERERADVEHIRLPDGRCVISVAGQGHLPCGVHPATDGGSDD